MSTWTIVGVGARARLGTPDRGQAMSRASMREHRPQLRRNMLPLVLAGLVTALLLGGCASGSGGAGTTPVSSQASPLEASQPASPDPTASPAPTAATLTSTHATWKYKRGDGYTSSVTFTVWTPVPKDVSGAFGHPEDASSTVDPTADYDPTTDVAIPFQVKLENTTSGFDLNDARTLVQLFGLSLGNSKMEISMDHPKLMDTILFFSDGRSTDNWQVYTENQLGYWYVKVMPANTDDTPIIITWSALSPKASSTVNAFIILHDYYSPATPAGATALLSRIAANPMTMDDWTVAGQSAPKALTLSGKIVPIQ